MTFKNTIIAICLALTLTACGEPTLDTTSKETMKASLKEMTKDMDAENKAKVEIGTLILAETYAKELGKDEALKKLDGLSADNILEKLAEIEAQEKAKRANRNK